MHQQQEAANNFYFAVLLKELRFYTTQKKNSGCRIQLFLRNISSNSKYTDLISFPSADLFLAGASAKTLPFLRVPLSQHLIYCRWKARWSTSSFDPNVTRRRWRHSPRGRITARPIVAQKSLFYLQTTLNTGLPTAAETIADELFSKQTTNHTVLCRL